MFDRSFVNRSVAWLSIAKTVYSSSFFSSSVSLCLYVFLTLLLTMSFLVTLCFCWPVRVNGGRYIDLIRSRYAALRAASASFNCVPHNHSKLWKYSSKGQRRSGELNKIIGLACQDMDELIGTLTFSICNSRRLTGVKTHSSVLSVFICTCNWNLSGR